MDNYEMVNSPKHYNIDGRKECIDEMVEIFGVIDTALWCIMTAYKYGYRAGLKPDNSAEQDVAKIMWYLKKADELMNKRSEVNKNES